jgi:maleate cis-trans isomerase
MSTDSASPGSIAWLKPGALDRNSMDVFQMTPADVRLQVFALPLSTAMMEAESFDGSGFDAVGRPQILDVVRGIAEYGHPAFTSVTGDLIQSAMGPTWDRGLRDDIAAITGTSAATAMTAITDCLDWLGVRRVAVATPFRDQQNAHVLKYLTDAGYEVSAIAGFPTHSLADVRKLPHDAPLTLGKDVVARDRSAEALFMACPLWAVGEYTPALEDATGVPVLGIVNTMVWAGLHALGHPGNVTGFGRILEDAQTPPSPAVAGAA